MYLRAGVWVILVTNHVIPRLDRGIQITRTVKLNVPDTVGAPDIRPVELLRVKPLGGRLPEMIDQL